MWTPCSLLYMFYLLIQVFCFLYIYFQQYDYKNRISAQSSLKINPQKEQLKKKGYKNYLLCDKNNIAKVLRYNMITITTFQMQDNNKFKTMKIANIPYSKNQSSVIPDIQLRICCSKHTNKPTRAMLQIK